ncbi:hypothetical protein [Gilliamella sp. Pas-s95]|uniref:hypothetical protein n=1 Tax=Gilliamella sp. Pas-s95 TaxID=2687317 RepID=UPI0013241B3D|nr:hypothetical protein [Gilliamella sp. Pas-s95]MWN05254.1 hypothetical protein [Gilliamella sp. Pas-s95]
MASGIWHLACQTYAQNLFQFHRSLNQTQFLFSSAKSFRVAKWTPSSRSLLAMSSAGTSATSLETSSETALVRSSATCSVKLSSISKWLLGPPLLSKPRLLFKPSLLSKSALFFVLLFLLSYSQGSVALTAQTSRVIEGGAPYFTFDGGRTRVTSRDDFVAITLPDGTRITPSTNTSSATNPIILPAGSTLGDIGMLVPPGYISRNLSDLVALGNWGDDDGDGQGTNGVTATGIISVYFSDKNGRSVSRSDILSACDSPYRVTLDVTHSSLTTQYGVPNSNTFSSQSATYYIKPDSSVVCYFVSHARPNLFFGGTGNNVSNLFDGSIFAGPANIWSPTKGFLTQSTDSSSYDRNFPTTGADGLYFDLEMPAGVNAGQLTWSVVTNGDITATVTSVAANDRWIPSADRGKVVARVKLSGPRADDTQKNSSNPSPLDVPSLPQTFELVGRDGRGNEVRYGFVIKRWFVSRGFSTVSYSIQSTWCRSLGYRLPRVGELSNSGSSSMNLSVNHYKRHIGSGFFTEWGYMRSYAGAGFSDYAHWAYTSSSGSDAYSASADIGGISYSSRNWGASIACVAP